MTQSRSWQLSLALAACLLCLSSKTQSGLSQIAPFVISSRRPRAVAPIRLRAFLLRRLTEQLGQQVVVDNRAGASGAIGMEMLVRANPDGYTIGYGNTPLLAINRSLLPNWPVRSGRNLQPVARLTNSQNLLTVTPSLPVKSVRELIDYAKQNPDKLIYASPGNGTTIHLSAELFKQMAGCAWCTCRTKPSRSRTRN